MDKNKIDNDLDLINLFKKEKKYEIKKTKIDKNNYEISDGGDFNLYIKYSKDLDFSTINEYFKNKGVTILAGIKNEDDYFSFSINSMEDEKIAINNEMVILGDKLPSWLKDIDKKYNVNDYNLGYIIHTRCQEEVKYVFYLASYIALQIDDILLYDSCVDIFFNAKEIKDFVDKL